MDKIRNLTTKEILELEQEFLNFDACFNHRYAIVRNTEAKVYKVILFEEINNFKDIVITKTFKTLKQLKQGLSEILGQYA